jgi:hypothetical protein
MICSMIQWIIEARQRQAEQYLRILGLNEEKNS